MVVRRCGDKMQWCGGSNVASDCDDDGDSDVDGDGD